MYLEMHKDQEKWDGGKLSTAELPIKAIFYKDDAKFKGSV